jgi:hypothetical protein
MSAKSSTEYIEKESCGVCDVLITHRGARRQYQCSSCQKPLCSGCVDLRKGCDVCLDSENFFCKSCAETECKLLKKHYVCAAHSKHW